MARIEELNDLPLRAVLGATGLIEKVVNEKGQKMGLVTAQDVFPKKSFTPSGVLTVTGTTAAQYIEIADLLALGAAPGDMFDIELHFSYTGSTNGKTFSIQAGDVAGTLTPLTNTTRNTASEVYLIGTYRIWIVSATQVMRQSSMLVAAGTNTTPSMVSQALDTENGPAKLYAGIQLASGAETASLIGYKVTPTRSL